MNELAQIVKTNELDPQDGQIIIDRFGSYEKTAQEWKSKAEMIVVTSRDQTTEMAMAREARKKFSLMRIDLEKARIAIGEPAYRKYKAINAVAKYLQALIQPIENHLLEQENFIKNDDARIAAEKRIEEERKLEAERLAQIEADRKEQERIKLENERLKKEADKRKAQMLKEREDARLKQEATEKKALAEKKKLEAKAEKEREDARKKQEDIENKARIAKQKADDEIKRIATELQNKKDAEEKAKKDAEIAEQKRLAEIKRKEEEALKASDSVKFKAYIKALSEVKAPEVQDEEIRAKIEKIRLFFTNNL